MLVLGESPLEGLAFAELVEPGLVALTSGLEATSWRWCIAGDEEPSSGRGPNLMRSLRPVLTTRTSPGFEFELALGVEHSEPVLLAHVMGAGNDVQVEEHTDDSAALVALATLAAPA